MEGEELIERCESCNGFIDINNPPYHKSADERFWHDLCVDGNPTDEPVWEYKEGNWEYLTNVPTQYNCGHYAQGPPRQTPNECPECGVEAV